MKKFEIFLIIGTVIGLLLVILEVPVNSLVAGAFFITLGVLYLYLGFALFNNIPFGEIFKARSYRGIGTWRIIVAIGTGLALSEITIGSLFTILNYPMAKIILIFGIVVAAIMIMLALVRNARDQNPFYRYIILRCLVFLIIAIIILIIPGQIFEKP